ncbi:MAG: hypothetical protein R3359_11185 [Marinirhabdus sp.]|nr:hypothetical protein [Marinirhabdus sp.]
MNLKQLMLLSAFAIALMACADDTKEKEAMAEKERIALEKTADSLALVNERIDSLSIEIEQTSDEIDALLNDINEN